MRSSLFPARLQSRVCAFCRQLQGPQRFEATRSLHAPSAPCQASRSTLALQPRRAPPRVPTKGMARRSFADSASVQSSQADTTPDAGAKAQPTKVPRTHYDFFPKTLPDGPPPRGRFEVDVRALRREFLALQAGAHPDLHPAHRKARAQAASARINEAFRTLESPLLRAQYVLGLRGVDVAGDETAKVADPALLMRVLEARERIEEAEAEGDLEPLRVENEERISACEDRLAALFAADDLAAAEAEAVRLRYWVNVRESINNWEKGKPVVLEH
ncbi:Co-chaperone Hsc20 [Xylaria palmicola]|nr:Co-chaperone Hsc20 [Xylaria palmicola]